MIQRQAFTRRDALRFASATAASSLLSARASAGAMSTPLGKVVVVGGGFGGATAAKHLRMWSGGRIAVTLVEPAWQFISCPMFNLVLGDVRCITGVTV